MIGCCTKHFPQARTQTTPTQPIKVNNVCFKIGECYAGALPASDTMCKFEQSIVRSRQSSPVS